MTTNKFIQKCLAQDKQRDEELRRAFGKWHEELYAAFYKMAQEI